MLITLQATTRTRNMLRGWRYATRAWARALGWRSMGGNILGKRWGELGGLGGLGGLGWSGGLVARRAVGEEGVEGDGGSGDGRGRAGLGHVQ